MRKFNYTAVAIMTFGASMLLAAGQDDFTSDEILAKVTDVVGQCRALIAEVDNMPESLWNPDLAFLSVPDTMRLFELQKEMSFDQYLDYINVLKERAGATKAHLINEINNWPGTLHKLNLAISEDLRAFATFCVNPINVIKDHLAQLSELGADPFDDYFDF